MFMRRIREYGMSRYIQTNARGFNEGDTKHFMRKIGEALFVNEVHGLRDTIEVGGIYKVRVIDHQSRTATYYRWDKMKCTGVYEHLATFQPIGGGSTVSYHYTDLCLGLLRKGGRCDRREDRAATDD